MSAHLALLALEGPTQLGSSGPDLSRYLFVCSLLIVLVACAGWIFRRVVAKSVQSRAAKRSLQVMDLLPLGGKQRLCVVRCYDRTFALGLGEKEIALIAELDGVIAPRAEAEPTQGDAHAFKQLVERALAERTVQPASKAPRGETVRPAKQRLGGELFG